MSDADLPAAAAGAAGGGGGGGEGFPQDEALMEAGARFNVLQVVLSRGLEEGREGVWDAGARCVQQLLNAPGAAEGEHFLQVLDWMHRFISVGESFSNRNARVAAAGLPGAAERRLLRRLPQAEPRRPRHHAREGALEAAAWLRYPFAAGGRQDRRGGAGGRGAAAAAAGGGGRQGGLRRQSIR